jgi:hypothetical protein
LSRPSRIFWLSIWAIVVVPVAYGLYLGAAYRVALAHGKLPFLSVSEWHWFAAYFLSLASGLLAIALITISDRWVRVGLCIAYVVLMGALLLGVSVVVACNSGDCF